MATMTAEQAGAAAAALERAKDMDFAQFWASLMELREEMRESQEKTDEQMRKDREARRKEHEEALERLRETERMIDKMAKQVGGVSNSVGELMEILIAGKVWEKFSKYPYKLKRAYRRIKLYDDNAEELTDVDILLVDTQYAMAIEVKRELDVKDIDHHLKQMKLIRKYPPLQLKVDKLLGAVAGGIVSAEARDYAHKVGFFVLELSGEQTKLVEPPKNFKPAEW